MRKLRIIGVDTESSLVECEAPDTGEKFALPLDERLRAAARGEYIPASGADRPPVTGTLRPREIQDRIRHGASPEEVAADAGVPLSRIEGFAIPVLLERSNAADLARASHPVLSDGPSLDTLADKVDAALDHRGIDPDLIKWDAWRDRSGGWVICISWPAGLSDDARATWAFEPDSHGGSTRALNEEAERILDPSRPATLRTVSSPPPQPAGPPPVRSVPTLTSAPFDQFGGQPSYDEDDMTPSTGRAPITAVPPAAPARPAAPADSPRLAPAPGTGTPAAVPPAAPASSTPAAVPPSAVTPPGAPADPRPVGPRPVDPRDAADPRPAPHRESGRPADPRPDVTRAGGPATAGKDAKPEDAADAEADEDFLQPTPTEPERKPSSRRHPTMPSWEDVLLGVRGKDD